MREWVSSAVFDDLAAKQLATRVVYSRCCEVGRKLHPVETWWIVRWAFRKAYGLQYGAAAAEEYADTICAMLANGE